MRICILVISLSTLHSSLSTAQHYIGAKVGYGAAQGRFYPKNETSMTWGKYTGGFIWRYYSPQPYWGGVAAELEFQQRGYRIVTDGIRSDTTTYTMRTRTVSSVTLPLVWQPHIYVAKQKIRLFLSGGFTLTYNTGRGDKLTEFVHRVDSNGIVDTTTETLPYQMQLARDNRWNYGFLAGGGVGFLFGKMEVFAEARYYYGMSDILRTKTRYVFNEQNSIRSELDNLFITVGVYFRLGKGGILEPARRKAAVPPRETDFRDIKLSF